MKTHHCHVCNKDFHLNGWGNHIKMHRVRGDDNVKVTIPYSSLPGITKTITYNFSLRRRQAELDAAVALRFDWRPLDVVDLFWGPERYNYGSNMTIKGTPMGGSVRNGFYYGINVDFMNFTIRLFIKKRGQSGEFIHIPGQDVSLGLLFGKFGDNVTPYKYHKTLAGVKAFAEKHYRESLVLGEQK